MHACIEFHLHQHTCIIRGREHSIPEDILSYQFECKAHAPLVASQGIGIFKDRIVAEW